MKIEELYVDPAVAGSGEIRRFERQLNLKAVLLQDVRDLYARVNASPDPVSAGKKSILLTRNRGSFVRDCPGTRHYHCCGYRILHVGTFCAMDCSYCILQSYFHPPVLQYFVNFDDMNRDLERFFASPEITRIGTGEFTDSLLWNLWTDATTRLIEAFSKQNTAVLELKTKTAAIDKLKGIDHRRGTIISWSLNTGRMIAAQERSTAGLDARLAAASICEKWGYPLAFHFDPVILYDDAEKEYRRVIQKLFSRIDSSNIVWISLGGFRYMPDLKSVIEKRFPASKIPCGEFIPGLDGKMRYFKPLRIALYRAMVDEIRLHAPETCVYFCMEDDSVWRKVMGYSPEEKGGISAMLDQAAVDVCGVSGEISPPVSRK